MARPLRSVESNMVYHVLNRANGREKIFKKQKDYQAFGDILIEAQEKYPMRILSFCLMPNHWHFVLYPKIGKQLSKFVGWLTHTHTQRYNAHYNSVGYGHVYQGRFKSFPVASDNYFLKLCRYVERNPLRAKLVDRAENWRWSSLWVRENGKEKDKALLSKWPIEMPENYSEWVNEKEPKEDKDLDHIRNSIRRGSPLGESGWVNATARKLGLQSTLKPFGRPKKGGCPPFSFM